MKIKMIFLQIVDGLLRNIGSAIGRRLRRTYYRQRLKSCGRRVVIQEGVFLQSPEYISLGDDVVIDQNVIILAGPGGREKTTKYIANPDCHVAPGEVRLGDACHLAPAVVIQGHGGVEIGDYFTASAQAMIYSLSNDPTRCQHGTVSKDREVFYVLTPVSIGNNTWLGLGSVFIGGSIGDHVFVKPNSVVVGGLDGENLVAAGNPARPVRARHYPEGSECH